MNAECVLNLQCALGEGPVWLDGQLFFVDIEAKKLIRFDPTSGVSESIYVGERIGCALPTTKGDWLVGLQSGLARVSFAKDALPKLFHTPAPHDPATARFNDGKTDPTGRAYAGTMSVNGEKGVGKLYRIDREMTVTKLVDDITTSNGMSWDTKLGVMYYTDTPTRKIEAFDWNGDTGEIANRRVVFSFPDGTGYPDGHTIDIHGNLWVAMWGGNAVLCVDPKAGKIIETIEVAATQVTSCCFGGATLDQLFITTARIGMNDELLAKFPQAGGVFRAAPGVHGLPTTLFGG